MTALARTFPGQRIYVPWQSPDAIERFRSNFAPLIGPDAVDTLMDLFGGLRIAVPTRRIPERSKGFVAVDVERVATLTAQHQTALQISQTMGCDPRSVHKARTKARSLGLLSHKRAKGAKL